jgi:drug/metabolite transporter, DME family
MSASHTTSPALSRPVPRLQLLAAAVLFSTGGAAIKSCTLSGWQVAGMRSAVAAIAVLFMVPAARQRWSWRILAVATVYAATLVLFVRANKLTTAANTIFLQSTAPLYILLLGPLLLGETITRRDLAVMAAIALGLVLLVTGVQPAFVSAPDPALGNTLAAFSGITWAGTVVGLRWIGSDARRPAGAAAAAVLAGNVVACAACLPAALPLGTVGWPDALIIVYLGVFQIGVSYALVTAAIRYVPALEAALLLLVEPALNPVWAWLVHGEAPGAWSLLGGAIILGATALKSWLDVRGR